jgi:hypothetical protein
MRSEGGKDAKADLSISFNAVKSFRGSETAVPE